MPKQLNARPMLGDIVRPLPYDSETGHGPLASGCSRYEDAVVVSVSPFVLVSRETEWSKARRRLTEARAT